MDQDPRCSTGGCLGNAFATGPDGAFRCIPCLRAYRDGMAAVARLGPEGADSALDMLVKLVGAVPEPDRPPVVDVTVVESLAVTLAKAQDAIFEATQRKSGNWLRLGISRDPEERKGAIEAMSKALGAPPTEVAEDYAAWRVL